VTGGVAGASGGAGGSGGAPPAKLEILALYSSREACLPPSAPVLETPEGLRDRQVPCWLAIVTSLKLGAACACDASQNLKPPPPEMAQIVLSEIEARGHCDGQVFGLDCINRCVCELPQHSGAALTQCQNDISTPITEMPGGFCYVDAILEPPLGNPALVQGCPGVWKHELRVVGPAPPEPVPTMWLGCTVQP
jgi:hypothetical protein